MKISKKALLDSIDTALAKFQADTMAYADATDVWQRQRRRKWLEEKQPQWKDLRDLLTHRLRQNEPITKADLGACLKRRGGYSAEYWSDHVFTADTAPPNPIEINGLKVYSPTAPLTELRALKAFLEASDEETFSMESLSRLGFKAPAWVFRAAVSR